VNLGPRVNTKASETPTCISSDVLELYFIDWPSPYRRPGGYGSTDIWVTRRSAKNETWKEPVNLGPPVSTSDDEGDASISTDGLTLYFHSDRLGSIGNTDLLVTTRATKQGRWGPPVNLGPTVNSSGVDSQPCILANDLVLLFVSDRAGGLGGYDIYITSRSEIDQPWSKPVNLGPTVNSPMEDWHPCVSPDGSTLIFASDRPGGLGDFDLWQAQIIPNVDFNGDGKVDIKDLEILIGYWGQNEPSVNIAPRPFGDGVVNVKDLEVLMSYWGQKVQRPTLSSP
jgi:Tol biopolymer transport system component